MFVFWTWSHKKQLQGQKVVLACCFIVITCVTWTLITSCRTSGISQQQHPCLEVLATCSSVMIGMHQPLRLHHVMFVTLWWQVLILAGVWHASQASMSTRWAHFLACHGVQGFANLDYYTIRRQVTVAAYCVIRYWTLLRQVARHLCIFVLIP